MAKMMRHRKIKEALKVIGKAARKAFQFILENWLFVGVLLLLYNENLVGAFLFCLFAIGVEIKEVGNQIKKSTDVKIKEEAEKQLKKAVDQTYKEMKRKGEL